MKFLSKLFKNNENTSTQQKYKIRQNEVVKIDSVFDAWTSADLNKMLKVVDVDTNPIDRHFLLQNIVSESYKLRKEEKYRKICIEHSEIHLAAFPEIAPALKKDFNGILPRVITFQYYATILTENGDYAKAIAVCESAISYGLSDGTKFDFAGRIERIKKKMNKN